MTHIINGISERHGRTPGMVDVNSYELIDGQRDGFETDRIALPWDVLDAENEQEFIEHYVCDKLNAETEL